MLENVEFGLKMHGAEKEERRARAMEALEMVGLSQLADRKPRALSGGQQQRVALARVLVTSPKALLLDEPLGDLDRLLQLRMRVELRNLQRQLGLMFIHVTHNQEESLSMADRIVVMHDGRIQQIADPLTISTRPENELVASFMGDNNILRGTVAAREGDRLVVDDGHVKVSVRAPGSSLAVGLPGHRSRSGRRRSRSMTTGRAGRRSQPAPGRRSSSSSTSATSSSSTSRWAASVCSPRWPATASRSSGAGRASTVADLLEGGGCPAPRGLTRPDDAAPRRRRDRAGRGARGAGAGPSGRSASRAAGAGSERRGWITAAWAAPGTLWLLFFLVGPVVMIILVSFWTPSLTGFEKNFTLENYRTLFGSDVYWDQLKDSFFVALIVVGACLLLGFPIAYFLTFKVQSLRNQVALFLVAAGAVPDELPDPGGGLAVPADGPPGRRQPGAAGHRPDRRAARDPRLLAALGRRSS